MTDMPDPPEGLEERGRRLWTSVHKQHPALSDPEREVVLEACRVADRLERLDAICRVSEPVIETDKGGLITHPAFAEARQQQNLLKQLVASLRLPDAATGKRPQTRPARGVQAPKGAGTVSSLERMRQRAAGG
ncbi:hypothetical protein [Streptosporangium sandarakinum]